MAKHKETELVDVKFDLPDTLTVRQQLNISNLLTFSGRNENTILLWWDIAKLHMRNWESAVIADPLTVDIDTETNREIVTIILWCANATASWYNELGKLEKNS